MVQLCRLIITCLVALTAVACPRAGFGADEVKHSGWRDVQNRMRISVADGSKYEVVGNEVKLESGAMLIEAWQSSTIKLPMTEIHPRSKSLVFARARQGCEHVFVLLGDAPVSVGQHRSPLGTGEEAIITDHEPKYNDLVGEDDIGRRRVRLTPLPGNKTFSLSEFSLIHAVEREPLVYQMVHSGDSKARALKQRLIKMAAVLNIVTARHGQYSTGLR